MISVSEAIEIIKNGTPEMAAENIDSADSIGRILAEDVVADMDLPPFDRSQMDGFAVKSKDTDAAPVKLKITGESIAGKGYDGEIKSGETVRIMTGARVPDGADAVQQVESTRAQNEDHVEILQAAKPNQNIVRRAAEIRRGALIFATGEPVTENMIASIASFGYAKVKVAQKPKTAILATGSEIVDVSEKPAPDQIRNSNSIMLEALAKKSGAETFVLPIARDEISNLKSRMLEALETSDVLLVTGGVSVGDYDFTKPALRQIGAEILFEKVSLKPGKPAVFARMGGKLIFGLPGNPVSVAVTFCLFVRTALLAMQGARVCELKKGFAVASEKIKGAKERDSYLPVLVETNDRGILTVASMRFRGSSNFIAFARANALVFVPQNTTLQTGDIAQILYLP